MTILQAKVRAGIGIHIRLEAGLVQMVEKAHRMHLPFFQCLLVHQNNRRLIEPNEQEVAAFKAACKRYRITVFQHASYYFNLCNPSTSAPIPSILVHELHIGQQLGLSHMVLHPGTIVGSATKQDTIVILAKVLDTLITEFPHTTFYLENTATTAAAAIGSNLHDFVTLRTHMQQASKLKFCIDTAHAYAYGYDIATIEGVDTFVTILSKTVGLKHIGLLHLNNTDKACGIGIDRHTGWRTGLIPPKCLLHFHNKVGLKKVPVILELPVRMPEQQELETVQMLYEQGEQDGKDSN